jgi:hypothetical protein
MRDENARLRLQLKATKEENSRLQAQIESLTKETASVVPAATMDS